MDLSDEERVPVKYSKKDSARRRSRSASPSRSSHKSYRHSPGASPPYSSKSKEEGYRRSKEDRKYYDRHKSNRRDRSRDRDNHSHKYEAARSRSRSKGRRSKSRSHSRGRRSKSRSPCKTKRSKSRSPRRSYREYSPKRNSDFQDRRKHFEPKTNKLSILEKMGIDFKAPENDQGTSSVLPSYYNPLVVNPARYAEQHAKRKLLWNSKTQKDEKEPTKNASIWQGAKFSQDQDGKMSAKFLRLMGMKEVKGEGNSQPDGKTKDLIKKQEELFSSMEMQYEVARATTHTQRGVGLGFGPRHIP